MDFNKFKKQQKTSADLERLAKAIEESTKKSDSADDRFWKYPELDKAGNAQAIIRFLPEPAVDGDDALPWVSYFEHGFKGPSGLWYIEKSLTSLGQKDPVSEYNTMLWNSNEDDNSPAKKQARAQKRKLRYISNILVIQDPKRPENEGKVFLFRYGKKIYDKIDQMLHPQFEEEKPVSVFNLYTGCNFKLRIRSVEGYSNYDSSVFEAPSPVAGTDEELKKLWESEYSLKEFVDPKTFKTYDQLKARLDEVLGLTNKPRTMSRSDEEDLNKNWSAPKATKVTRRPEPEVEETDEEESQSRTAPAGDDDLEYFRKLAEG